MITIHTLAYNEELMLPHFIAHYRSRFPNCRIRVYDNESTDRTREIAFAEGCDVEMYSTNNQLSDSRYLQIKNHCWKTAKTDWVLVADVDELCDISEDVLVKEGARGGNVIDFLGFNMVNMRNDLNVGAINTGVRSESYDKKYCFNKKHIAEINYGPGCHHAYPKGRVVKSEHAYICRHYKYINPDYMVSRHAAFAARLSEENIQRGYGAHYQYSEATIRKEFADVRKNARTIEELLKSMA